MTETSVVAIVGAGGKTSAAFTLARESARAVVTATTHLGPHQPEAADGHVVWEPGSSLPDSLLHSRAAVLAVTGPFDNATNRWTGVGPEIFGVLGESCRRTGRVLVAEADGSRGRPLKAPADHEPVIPPGTDRVVVVAGLNGLGTPLTSEFVHRSERFAALSGLRPGLSIDSSSLIRVLAHPDGGLKGVPADTAPVVLLSHADGERAALVRPMAPVLLRAFAGVVAAGHVAGTRPVSAGGVSPLVPVAAHVRVAGIVLAGGASTRFGRPKPLLEFGGAPFVRVVAQTALAAGLSPVVVVVGARGDDVAAAVEALPVVIVRNGDWAAGQSSSVRAGVGALSAWTGAAIFLMADQPQLPARLLTALSDRHALGLGSVVAPVVSGRRTTPVLFDASTFGELLQLSGDQGGRPVIDCHGFEPVHWPDDRLLLDVDTPQDYERLCGLPEP